MTDYHESANYLRAYRQAIATIQRAGTPGPRVVEAIPKLKPITAKVQLPSQGTRRQTGRMEARKGPLERGCEP